MTRALQVTTETSEAWLRPLCVRRPAGSLFGPEDSSKEALVQETAEPGTLASSPLFSPCAYGPPFSKPEAPVQIHTLAVMYAYPSVWLSTRQESVLPARNILIQAFAIVQTSAQLKANL